MARLGDTYDRAPESRAVAGQSSQERPRINNEPSLSSRASICFGDVIAVLFGGIVFCFGVIFWVSPTIGLFESVIGMQRLAELTTSLGITTIAVWGLLLYSLGRETRSQGKSSQPTPADGLARLSNQDLKMGKLLLLLGLFVSDSEQDRL